MNILIVSSESWRDTNNGGNVLSNIFSCFPDACIAQIYCSGELPQNSVCRKYFQIADTMLLTRKKGRALEERFYGEETSAQPEAAENKIKSRIPHFLRDFFLLAREFLWTVSDWKTKDLEQFVSDFRPDIIFAPCYAYFHVSKLALHVKHIANCPMISYISDDNYSLKQLNPAPSFWINRLITRKWIRRHFAESALVYTMTDLQKQEYEALLKRPMKILCKAAEFSAPERREGDTVRLIYAGGLYLNRWKMLSKLAEAVAEINRTETKAELHIYSGSKLKSRQSQKLDDGKNSFLHDGIPYRELMERYRESDIAVHTESFDLKNRLITRLSFSTKIIDCMSSGCAILAIGPCTQAGISYLKENDAAVCVDNTEDLYGAVGKLVEDRMLIWTYADKAYRLGMRNHCRENIEKSVRRDFCDVIAEYGKDIKQRAERL